MSKDVYYFSHDSNARRDPKMVALISKYGPEGYGVFFMLVEIMSEQHAYRIEKFPKLEDGLSREMGISAERIREVLKYIISECELLKEDNRYIWSDSLARRKEMQEVKRQAKVEAGRIGGYKSGEARGSKTKQNEAVLEATNQSKVKESKVEQSKEEENTTTETAKAVELVDNAKPVDWSKCNTELQSFMAYYIKEEMPAIYKSGTQAQVSGLFKRFGRPASELLSIAGSLPIAIRVFELSRAFYNKKGLSWNLSTVLANSGDFLNQALQEKINGNGK